MTIPAALRGAGERFKPRGPFTPAHDPRCVCGHAFSDHHEPTVLSVPLSWRPPLYELPGNSPIAVSLPADTAQVQQCACGCTLPVHDHCEYQVSMPSDSGGEKGVPCRLDNGHCGDHAA